MAAPALGALLTVSLTASPAVAAPRALSVGLDRSAVADRPLEARVQAVDPTGPVTGLMATFGRRGDAFGSSACMPRDSRGRLPHSGPFSPGARSTLAAPSTYPRAGRFRVRLRVAGGGCDTGKGGSVLAPLRVTVVRPGQRPVPPRPEAPVGLLPGDLVGPLPGVRPLDGPDALLPGLIGGAAAFDGPIAGTAGRRCRGDRSRLGRSVAARRRSRRALLCLLNKERRARGMRSVRDNRRADKAARLHSLRMVRLRFFSHIGPRGLDPATRLRHARYLPRRGGRWFVGEDIGFGRGRGGTPLGMFRGFMHSTPHRAVILEPAFRDLGLGLVRGRPVGRGGATYTLDFGRRH